jgi:hypothetical protein
MNVPDLRNVDFDAYRRHAAALRAQAFQEAIDRLVAALRAAPAERSRKPTAGRAAATHCPA